MRRVASIASPAAAIIAPSSRALATGSGPCWVSMCRPLADTPLRPSLLALSISQSYLIGYRRPRAAYLPSGPLQRAADDFAMLTANETLVRLTVFACVLAALAVWE